MPTNISAMRTPRMRLVAVVAAVALAAAACGNGGEGAGPTTLEVTGTDALAFEPAELSAPPGTITVELTSGEAVEHTFVIEELDDTEVVAAPAGETASGSIDLEAGTYAFYCSIPGHRESGMEGELSITS